MNTLQLVAQIVPPDWFGSLSNFGLAGVTIAFFMWWHVNWGRRMESALNRVARANSLLVISLKQAHDEAKHQAREILAEIDHVERRGE